MNASTKDLRALEKGWNEQTGEIIRLDIVRI